VQAAIDAAVADALANIPADTESTVFGIDIPTFCVIVALLLIIVAGLGVIAYKNNLFSKKKEGSE
jgi:disulfide bond formation protein DsbB